MNQTRHVGATGASHALPLEFQVFPAEDDPRFSVALHRPASTARGLLVAIHDSEREYEGFFDGFSAFARQHAFALAAPIFPPGVRGDGYADGYKFLHEGELRYDSVLLGMLASIRRSLVVDTHHVLIHGYSGGAQFVQRFVTLHPHAVTAAAIAAPGEVTLPDETAPWWSGVADAPALFGRTVDWTQLANVRLDLSVGENDTHTHQLKEQPPSRFWTSDEERLTSNRQQRLEVLHRAWAEKGVAASFALLPGVDHAGGHLAAIQRAITHFSDCLGINS